MDLPTRAAQLLMVGVESTSVEPPAAVSSAVAELGIGAVILTGRDPVAATSVRDLVDGLQQAAEGSPAGVRLEVSTDQEGGQVQALTGEGFASMPSALVQGASSPRALRRDAAQWGRELAAAGVTLDLAPVADVVPPGTANAPIGDYDREFGHSVDAVTPAVRAFVRGMGAAGVASTIKHFPGLGRATGNTDTTAGVVDDLTTRHDPFLRPFVVGIAAGAPYVMMSTATYRQIDGDHIAAYSRTIVGGMLRGDLGFNGVVISDDVGIAESVADVPVGLRAVRFVAAGGDVVLTVVPEQAPTMVDALVERARSTPAFRDLVRAAAVRVLTRKVRAGLADCP